MIFQADAAHLPLANRSVDLVLGSPPYCDARTYGIGAQRQCQEWVDWMMIVSGEACRVSRGLVIWIAAGVTRNWIYQPACEGLMYRWWQSGGGIWRPAHWHRVGIPGSGGKKWLRSDIEYALCFHSKELDPRTIYGVPTANGHPPKWGLGGKMSHRTPDGARVNQLGHYFDSVHGSRDGVRRGKNGEEVEQNCTVPAIANPGNLIQGIPVGGGSLGHHLAHDNEAPYPIKLAQWFIRGWCPPKGRVFDPFLGSGTTMHAAKEEGRIGIGSDIRLNQCQLTARRMVDVNRQGVLFK